MAAASGSINLKPNKPDSFGKRDYLVVNTWLYKVEQYLALMQLGNPGVVLDDGNRILYASTFLVGTTRCVVVHVGSGEASANHMGSVQGSRGEGVCPR